MKIRRLELISGVTIPNSGGMPLKHFTSDHYGLTREDDGVAVANKATGELLTVVGVANIASYLPEPEKPAPKQVAKGRGR
jgi:hypothetical protein